MTLATSLVGRLGSGGHKFSSELKSEGFPSRGVAAKVLCLGQAPDSSTEKTQVFQLFFLLLLQVLQVLQVCAHNNGLFIRVGHVASRDRHVL